MKLRTIFTLLFSSIILSGQSQTVPATLEAMLNNTLDSMRNDLNNKSLSAAIQLQDDAIWAKASGISSLVPYADAQTYDTYEIGSVAKTLTAACVLHLADQGMLSLDDSLHEWIDTIPYVNPDITIRQLLRHQSGLYEVLSNPAFQPTLLSDMDSIWTAQDFITSFIQPAPGVPGGGFAYCNTNYFLLGAVVEEVTGNPFHTEIRNRFLTPLNLTTLAIPSLEPFSSPVAHVWMDTDGDGFSDDAHSFFYNWMSFNSAVAAAGGYYGTASEVSQWMRAYMRGDFHSPSIMSEAKTTISAGGMPVTYGLGLMRKTFVGYVGYGHGGDVSYSASSWYFPALDISISVLNNDSEISSWELIPVVTELLKTYNQWAATVTVQEQAIADLNLTAFPNPFTNEVSARINVNEQTANVRLILRNTLGQELSATNAQMLVAGENRIVLDGLENIPAGIYFLGLSIDGREIKTTKLIRQ